MNEGPVEPPREPLAEVVLPAEQDNSPALFPAKAAIVEPAPAPEPPPAPPEAPIVTAAPLFRARADLAKSSPAAIPPVIPLVRPPDDPGIDDEAARDEFAEQVGPAQGQAGGWRGFLARWGG